MTTVDLLTTTREPYLTKYATRVAYLVLSRPYLAKYGLLKIK